jgi:hypothetical protein
VGEASDDVGEASGLVDGASHSFGSTSLPVGRSSQSLCRPTFDVALPVHPERSPPFVYSLSDDGLGGSGNGLSTVPDDVDS